MPHCFARSNVVCCAMHSAQSSVGLGKTTAEMEGLGGDFCAPGGKTGAVRGGSTAIQSHGDLAQAQHVCCATKLLATCNMFR
jgi:hypothetical protein